MRRDDRAATRRNAFGRLALLSAKENGDSQGQDSDIGRLCAIAHQRRKSHDNAASDRTTEVSAVPMGAREIDVLLALCKAAPLVASLAGAENLLGSLEPYASEAHKQAIDPSAFVPGECPWETLSYQLTAATLHIGAKHPELVERAQNCIHSTLEAFGITAHQMIEEGQDEGVRRQSQTVQFTTSLIGFLRALASQVAIWETDQRPGLLRRIRRMLSEELMTAIEGGLSAVRNARGQNRVGNKEWILWIRHYTAKEQPLGALLIQQAYSYLVESFAAACFELGTDTSPGSVLDLLLRQSSPSSSLHLPDVDLVVLGAYSSAAMDGLHLLDADADYLQVSSPRLQRLALDVQASCLRTYMYCSIMDRSVADPNVISMWLEDTINDPMEMADGGFAEVVLTCMILLARHSPQLASSYSSVLPRLLVQGKLAPRTAILAGQALAQIAKSLSQDAVISTIYSLGNVLSGAPSPEKPGTTNLFVNVNGPVSKDLGSFALQPNLGSAISLVASDEEEMMAVYGTVVQTIAAIAVAYDDERITALVAPLLIQKMGRISNTVDARIVTETAALGLCRGGGQLNGLLKFYARASAQANASGDHGLLNAVELARLRLSTAIRKSSPLYEIYLTHLLNLVVSSGDTAGDARTVDVALAARTISQLLRPLAVLVSADPGLTPEFDDADGIRTLSRDAWFNLAVHGFTLDSKACKEHAAELQALAQYSLPFIDEERVFASESGIDLNTVLRRGASQQATLEQKSSLAASLPSCEGDVRGLNYTECVFVQAVLLVCVLRARSGDCTFVLPFFCENKAKSLTMSNCLLGIATLATNTYLDRAMRGRQQKFAAPEIATQLAKLFEGCCNRIAKVQRGATLCAERIIAAVPSALCQKSAMFALLELLSLLWRSCLDAETDAYNWQPAYHSRRGNVTVLVSDDVALRQKTLASFHKQCRLWVSKAMDAAPLDLKGLLQAYLEDFEDDGAYGHIALGRSFAVEMGSMIPASDERLTSIDRQNTVGISTASDFIAQYTTRQQYRAPESLQAFEDRIGITNYDGRSAPVDAISEHIARQLRELHERIRRQKTVQFVEIQEALRNAASCLSKNRSESISLIQDMVGIPFTLFTKESIKFGISIWMGVSKENPSLQSRVLVEVAAGWESSLRLKRGFFNNSVLHVDPFYLKEEFAPTSQEALAKRQQVVHDLLQPHLRLVNLLSSYFSATRLTSPSVERVYARLMRITMLSMKNTVTQPLARETHFHFVLLALRVLRFSTSLDNAMQCRLKDATLSAGLAWFSHPAKWSFGSNRLQVKAEIKLLGEVAFQVQSLSAIGTVKGGLFNLQHKQNLLLQLMSQEVARLTVWIQPLANESRTLSLPGGNASVSKDSLAPNLLACAWAEDPHLAVQLVNGQHSSQLASAVRRLLLLYPQMAISEPDALSILLGAALPGDIKTQLKYLLYWAPINPMAAVTYFLPAYGNHPFIIQYAVRALESHSVDVTFFYVPQIVQTLRYDGLGYVERYIIETAKFSQLFAHQIVWNMKANAYKDEDSQEPDGIKPELDRVTDALISSFSNEDRDFYEREFDFFGKVTGISGTLKPFIKRPKPEKKAKIEEELRKIQVDAGVYLPSNPDGVVVGIDRKSGKPLQSHAKAPYMATFRIRKEKAEDEGQAVAENGDGSGGRKTYDVWQSAIFKVGDDCRQDVLALQMIAAFRGIFNSAGLDVYVFPYRVTATAPGCGVIDVLPNSISRDMLGREAVNGLYEYFVSKYGNEDSLRFQEARRNFIKSMAAYSIISYLLQFKDRHNGNIMVDDAGHVLHIDFGFCFDIAPGGIKFERAPFKLTPEMVAVMGGSTTSQPFRAFEELTVKAFLAARQYVEPLSHIVVTMLDSGLPCFKPQTMQHFKERFVLEKSEREAADFVRKLVHLSERSYSTGVYDYFQLLTNGIPY